MSDIAKLYEQVMADTQTNGGPQFDGEFFAKVASGDDEATQTLNEVIEEARANGASDDQIEAALTEAVEASGYEEGNDQGDDFENAKMSAYVEGSQQAIEDMLASDLAKTAGITADDLLEYELGTHYGAGYAETRRELEDAMDKIAAAKPKAPPGFLKKVHEVLKGSYTGKPLEGKARAAAIAKLKAEHPKKGHQSILNLMKKQQTSKAKWAGRGATATMIGAPVGLAGAAGGLGYAAGRNRD